MDSVGVTYMIGGSLGYLCGIHIESGNRYVLPRKLTGSVPERCTSSALAPSGEAGRSDSVLV